MLQDGGRRRSTKELMSRNLSEACVAAAADVVAMELPSVGTVELKYYVILLR